MIGISIFPPKTYYKLISLWRIVFLGFYMDNTWKKEKKNYITAVVFDNIEKYLCISLFPFYLLSPIL